MEAEGEAVPALETKPEIYPDLLPDYLAFCQLSNSRPMGFAGAKPITLNEILAYMQIFDISGIQERKLFLKRIRIMDRIYLEWRRDKQATNGKPIHSSNPAGRGKVQRTR